MEVNETFLGYAVFYDGKPFPSSGNTVTRDKLYLRAHALYKLNKIDAITCGDRADCSIHINRKWKEQRKLSLRRVYAR